MHHKASYITTVLTVLFTIASALVFNIATSNGESLPADLKQFFPWRWLLVGFIALCGIALAVWQHHQKEKTEEATSTSSTVGSHNKQYMLKRVRSFWITGVLEQSPHREDFITLGLREKPDAVEHPWRSANQEMNQPEHLLPPSTRITDVYKNTDSALLILGEPGSGKTTLLLEL